MDRSERVVAPIPAMLLEPDTVLDLPFNLPVGFFGIAFVVPAEIGPPLSAVWIHIIPAGISMSLLPEIAALHPKQIRGLRRARSRDRNIIRRVVLPGIDLQVINPHDRRSHEAEHVEAVFGSTECDALCRQLPKIGRRLRR